MRIGEYETRPASLGGGKPTARTIEVPVSHADTRPALPGEALVLAQLGFGKPVIEEMARRAARSGATLEQELLSDGWVDENAYYAALARLLGLPFHAALDPEHITDSLAIDTQLTTPIAVRYTPPDRPPVTMIVPEARRAGHIRQTIARLPLLHDRLAVCSASSLRGAVWQAGAERRVRNTVTGLFDWQSRFSARIVFWGNQGFYTGLIAATLLATLLMAPATTILCLHIVLSLLYFSVLILRLVALSMTSPVHRQQPTVYPDHELPVYTVMVALYREAAITEQLVGVLRRLDWPASRLDIKLVCEADDLETLEALRVLKPGPQFEIVEVPAMHPRTKPKALSYALPAARGEFLAIYDAEDRPHPEQLRQAYAKFRSAPPEIACLQAPLIITNARDSWISALFSLEYAGLFRALLPFLARHRMPLPLGGTSNHFRTDILRTVQGWDPFNVTEDADLGMRLYRLGYRSDVISRQTLEDAPATMNVWIGQRTRWFKGWLQTWLVMMRDPWRLRQEMGTRAFAVFHLLIGGMLLSSLAHPFIVIFFTTSLIAMAQAPAETVGFLEILLFTVDFVNVIGAYAIFLALGASAMIRHEKKQIGWRAAAVPLYWMMVSYAAWRSVFELRSNPFFWNKTPHQPTVTPHNAKQRS